MVKTVIFENIGFGDFAEGEIRIEMYYSPSNDFEGCRCIVKSDNVYAVRSDLSVCDNIRWCLDDEETAEWIIKHL